MPLRRTTVCRTAVAALAASAMMLAPGVSQGRIVRAPDVAARPGTVSLVLASTRAQAHPHRWDSILDAPSPAATPTPPATATPPEPPPAAAVAAPPSAPKPPVRRPPTAPAPAPSSTGWYGDAYAARVRDLVDAERAGVGLAPLSLEPRLSASARAYSKVLSDNNSLSHVGPDGSTLVTRAEAAGFPFTVRLGEVLAWGNEGLPPEGLVRAWMNSPTHRAEILSPGFVRAGIGCYVTPASGVTVYCVMDLAG